MPDPTPALQQWLWLGLAAAVLAALLSMLSALVERSGTIRLRHWSREAGGRLRAVYDRPTRFEVFRWLLSACAKLGVAVAVLPLAAAGEVLLGDEPAGAMAALAAVGLLVGAVEVVNRTLVGHDPEGALRRLTPIYAVVLAALSPAIWLLAPLLPGSAVRRRAENDEDEASADEIEAYIRVGTREGILEPGEEELVRGIVDFGDKQVRSVMTPRIDMVCAPLDSDLESLVDLFLLSNHSRIPLYRSSIDHVVGTLHLRDVLTALRGDGRGLEALTKPPYFVPETKRLDELLREFQARQLQMAIAVDEYGGTAGLVTAEDLVEEIVGEIPDEGEEIPVNESLPDGRWRFDGRAHVEEMEEAFAMELGGSGYETVGGLIFGTLGHVPQEGDSVETHGLRLVVEGVADRRVLSVLAEELPRPAEEEGTGV